MAKLSFLTEDEKKGQPDAPVALQGQTWQLARIDEGIRQDDAGEYATDEEVKAVFDLWKRRTC